MPVKNYVRTEGWRRCPKQHKNNMKAYKEEGGLLKEGAYAHVALSDYLQSILNKYNYHHFV